MTGILFDLDGTLLNTLDDLMDAVNHTMEVFGYPRHSREEVRRFVGNGAGRLLLAHNAKFRGNMHGLVAGFVEAGETMEEAVRRELREEVKLEVKNIRYFASQSWPYPNSLMAGFTAELAEKDAVPIPDMREITAAGFYTPSDMPEVPPPGSIARRMIDHWRENYKGTLS